MAAKLTEEIWEQINKDDSWASSREEPQVKVTKLADKLTEENEKISNKDGRKAYSGEWRDK